MNRKILKYELKRLFLTKSYIGIAIAGLIYSYYIFMNHTLFGVCYTAPFSTQSFKDYLIWNLPILLCMIVVLMIRILIKSEKRVRNITNSMPIDQKLQLLLKVLPILILFLMQLVLECILCFWLYHQFFQINAFAEYFNIILLYGILPGVGLFVGLGVVVLVLQ